MAHLKVLSSDSPEFTGKELPLSGDEITIGRQADSTILVPDAAVSRRHAKIVRTPEGLLLVDDGGRNGLFVNGERVTHRLIEDGDVIRVGHSEMAFKSGTDSHPPARREARPKPTRTPLEERLEQTTMLEPLREAAPQHESARSADSEPARQARKATPKVAGIPCPACSMPLPRDAASCDHCGAITSHPLHGVEVGAAHASGVPRVIAAMGLFAAGIVLVLSVLMAREHGLIGHHARGGAASRPIGPGPHTGAR